MKLYCDNKSAISIAHNLIQHDPTKHIDIDRHFIKEKLKSSLVTIPYVSSSNKLVDVLTEGCLQHGFKKLLASQEWYTSVLQFEGELEGADILSQNIFQYRLSQNLCFKFLTLVICLDILFDLFLKYRDFTLFDLFHKYRDLNH